MNQIVPIKAAGVELLDLRDRGQCKFPVHTDGKHHTFCGLPSVGSWCDTHEKIVWTEGKHPMDRARSRFRKRVR
jgi:hypothetical protein